MTTSLLLCQTRDINTFDLQVLKDYALEAPWNWRVLLETLIEEVEDARKQEELEEELDAMKESFKETRQQLNAISAELTGLIPADGETVGKFMPWITPVSAPDGDVKTLRARLTALHAKIDELIGEMELEEAESVAPLAPHAVTHLTTHHTP